MLASLCWWLISNALPSNAAVSTEMTEPLAVRVSRTLKPTMFSAIGSPVWISVAVLVRTGMAAM